MREEDAVFGGEHSGHFYFRDNWYADSGLIAMLTTLELVSEAGKPALRGPAPLDTRFRSGEINTECHRREVDHGRGRGVHAAEGAEIDHLDGVTVAFRIWWFNLRVEHENESVATPKCGKADQQALLDEKTTEVLKLIRPPDHEGSTATPTSIVRIATIDDADAIARIYNEGIADRIATFETNPRTPEMITAWFDGKHPVVVVEANGEIVAFASTSTYRPRDCYRHVAEFSVYVDRAHRGHGFGRMAMEVSLKPPAKQQSQQARLTASGEPGKSLPPRPAWISGSRDLRAARTTRWRLAGMRGDRREITDVLTFRDCIMKNRSALWQSAHRCRSLGTVRNRSEAPAQAPARRGRHLDRERVDPDGNGSRSLSRHQTASHPEVGPGGRARRRSQPGRCPTSPRGELTIATGDTLHERFSCEHPFNAFGVMSPAGDLKGWYANVTWPTFLEATPDGLVLTWQDLVLDIIALPNGHIAHLDDDELAESPIPRAFPLLASAIIATRDHLTTLATSSLPPFTKPSGSTPSKHSTQT